MQDVKDGENAGTGKPVQEYFFPERENRALPRTDGSALFSVRPALSSRGQDRTRVISA